MGHRPGDNRAAWERTDAREPAPERSGLEVAAILTSVGSLVFLWAPMMFGAFAVLVALAGAGMGWVAHQRGGGVVSRLATVVGSVVAFLFLLTLMGS